MAQVVFRMAKLKSFGNIGGAGAHNLRTRPTPNADPRRKNIVLVGPRTGEGVVDAVKQKLDGITVRKNAVLAVEVIISASPEYFRPDDPTRAGYWDEKKLDAWRAAVEPFIREKFPHAVSVVLHLDEATPHYQIIDVPINDTTGKLDARSKYGGKAALSKWQTDAAKPVAKLGIERGKEGSKAEHVPIKIFYGLVNAPNPTPLPKPINPPAALPPASFIERVPGTDAAAARKTLEEKHAVADAAAKKRAEERKREALKAHPILVAKAKVSELVDGKIKGLERSWQGASDALKKERQASAQKDAEIQALRAEADKLRALPIGDVLERLYGGELCDGSKPEHKTRKYQLADGQKIGVSPGKTGGEVWVHQGTTKGSRSAIDLVMLLDQCDYKTALKTLGDAFGAVPVAREHARALVEKATQEVKAAIDEPTPAPTPQAFLWPRVRKWLHEARALPVRLVDWAHRLGLVYADSKANAVFPRAEGGAFLRGITDKPFKRTVGNKLQGPYEVIGPGDVIICESPTDALSIKAMHSSVHVIATGGNLLRPDDVKKHVPPGRAVWLAFDNDEQGKKYNTEYQAVFADAKALKLNKNAKDWNDALQRGLVEIDDAWQPPVGGGGEEEQHRSTERMR